MLEGSDRTDVRLCADRASRRGDASIRLLGLSNRRHRVHRLAFRARLFSRWRLQSRNAFPLGCVSGGQVQVTLTGRVSGRFSDDGRAISAEEVLSYLVVRTGEQVDVRYRWAATAPAE